MSASTTVDRADRCRPHPSRTSPPPRWWSPPRNQAAPGRGPGAPSAVRDGDASTSPTGCACRSGQGRGMANVVARSADGVRFEHRRGGGQGPVRRRVAGAAGAGPHARGPVAAVRELRDAGHQALVGRRAGGRHTRGPGGRAARTVLPGSDRHAVKDPVRAARRAAGTCGRRCTRWTLPQHEDRMTTEYATSPDGSSGPGAAPRCAGRRARGTPAACGSARSFDGPRPPGRDLRRPGHAAENWEERTGLALRPGGRLLRVGR